MSKKSAVGMIIIIVLLVTGFVWWKRSNPRPAIDYDSHQTIPPNLEQKDQADTDTSHWKTYRSEEYGFELRYPSETYSIKEEERLIHFYHNKCAQVAELPAKDCINLNLQVANTPNEVTNVEELEQISKQGGLSYPINLAADYKKEIFGENEFLVSKFFHEDGTFLWPVSRPWVINFITTWTSS